MGSRLFQFGLLFGTVVGVVACSDGASVEQRHQDLTVEQNRVLGFETPVADWSSPQSAVIGASAVSSEGNAALSVIISGYTEFHSTAIPAPGSSNSQAQLDILIPQSLAWGEARLIFKAPSQGIYWRDLGGISLQGLPPGDYQTLNFQLPSEIQSVLAGTSADVSFIVTVNAQSGLGAFQLDNLRVANGDNTEPGLPPQDLIHVELPFHQDIRDTPLAANGRLMVRDRATAIVEADAATVPALFPLINIGSDVSEIGAWAHIGSLVSRANVTIRSGANVDGDVTSSGLVTIQDPEDVGGTTTENVSIPENEEVSWPAPLQANPSAPETLGVGEIRELAPGAYGKVTVYSNAELRLRSGNYAFTDLQLEPNAKIVLDVDENIGPIALYLDSIVAYRGDIVSENADAAKSFLLVYRGTQNLRLERESHMAIVAPHATVEFATGGISHRGSVYAHGVHLEPDVILSYVPFEYWDWILPPRPIADCVMPAGAGSYMAAFGYKNQRPAELNIEGGSFNFFSPDSTRNIPVLSDFKSGEFHEVVWVDMPSTGVTWEVHGQKATVDLSSPVCDFEHGRAEIEAPHGTHTRTGANRPPAPGTKKNLVFAHNALGAGTLVQERVTTGEFVHTYSVLAAGGPLDGLAPGLGQAPVIAQAGPRTNPIVPVKLELTTQAEREGLWEVAIVEVKAKVGGTSYPRRRYDAESAHCDDGIFFWTAFKPCGAGASLSFFGGVEDLVGDVDFDFYEPDDFSADEHIWSRMTIDASAGTYAGYSQVRKGDPLHFDRPFGATRWHDDGKGNRAEWTVRQVSLPTMGSPVKICATWPAYYTDTGKESLQGHDVNGSEVRAYPASFAKYTLRAVSPFHLTEQEGSLDAEGCIPASEQVNAEQLAYLASEVSGDPDEGGLEFHLELEGKLTVPGSGGAAEFFVYDYEDVQLRMNDDDELEGVWPPKPLKVVYHLTRFDAVDPAFNGELLSPAWTVQDGIAVPADIIVLAGHEHNDGSNVAATMSQTLSTLQAQGTPLPQGSYPIEYNSPGSSFGAFDYNCRITGDSNAGTVASYNRAGVEIGRATFTCAEEQECLPCASNSECASGSCVANQCKPTSDCRTPCSSDAQCAGGQSCLEEIQLSDDFQPGQDGRVAPGNACDGGSCYCAWAPQGSAKFVNAHEFGHMIQKLLAGNVTSGDYLYACPENGDSALSDFEACSMFGTVFTYAYNDYRGELQIDYYLQDPPGMADECACNHVNIANGAHCLQSLEITPYAQGEGYAQYFASMVWNKPGADCYFNYYKEFLSSECRSDDPANCYARDGMIVTTPPVSLRCDEMLSWRNANQCGASLDLTRPDAEQNPLDMSTELDWMTFLAEINQSIPFGDIMNVYRRACQPENQETDEAGGARPLCVDDQAPAEGCFDPNLTCSDGVGFDYVRINNGLTQRSAVAGRSVYWRDRPIPEDAASDWDEFPPFDRGGFLDGAIRRFGLDSTEAENIEILGLAHAVADELP